MIETARLRLRNWQEADKPRFDAIINTPAMMAHFGGVKPCAEIDALVDRMIRSQEECGFTMWAVDLRETGELIGICGLRRSPVYADTPVGGMLEIGWRIAEPFWGVGLAREAAEASLAWGWANQHDDAIAAWTGERNTRSWRLMHRLGMARRADLDFHHPWYAVDDPLGAMIVYAARRP